MGELNITLLNELDVLRDDYTLKVRIVSMLTKPLFNGMPGFFSKNMIIMDEEGNKSHCSVSYKHYRDVGNLLNLNECLFIRRPTLAENKANFKYVYCPYKISLNQNTVITRCNNFAGSKHGFEFATFQSILDRSINENLTFDVIGIIVNCYNLVKDIKPDGKESMRLNLRIEDLSSCQLPITLWDDYAEQMSLFVRENIDPTNVVIILQFAKFGLWNTQIQVSNCYDAARLYINDDIDEINQFKERLIAQGCKESSSSLRSIGSYVVTSLEEEFIKPDDYTCINDIGLVTEVKTIIIIGTIKAIVKNDEWFYHGCKSCNRKVYPKLVVNEAGDVEEKKVYECSNDKCSKSAISVAPRYKIKIRVQDSSGVVSPTMFEREASKLLKMSSYDLLEKVLEGNAELFPEELYVLVGKKFVFKISVKTFNLNNIGEAYSISKMTDDPKILSLVGNKLDDQQMIDSDSMNCTTSDTPLTTPVLPKDSKSFIGDNVMPTPDSVNTAFVDLTPTNMSDTDCVKRILADVYDIEDTSAQSSSRIRPCHEKDEDNIKGKQSLLTPKIEK